MITADELREEATRLRLKANAIEDGTQRLFRKRRALRTARDLARSAGITDQAANNRLAALWRAGYLERQPALRHRGGRIYLYTATEEFLR